ncbi:MAG TPA: ComF family protein [Anaerolineales bacterium]|nr:ComF family protein [Anaerolineales bacterium]
MNSTPWSYRLYRLTWTGLDLLFPPTCGGCGKVGWRWCPECQARVPRINKPFCETCGIPTQGSTSCEKCKLNPPAYQMMRSWAVFDSPIQNALHAMKYRRNIGLGESIAIQMVDFVRSLNWPIEITIPVPLGKKRLIERGYNQVALVARPLAFRLGLKYESDALQKVRETRSQVGLTVSQRHENVQNVYWADTNIVNGKSILIMDDVATTGSTISACTEALLSAGVREIYVLTIARALSHHSLDRV